MLSYCVLHFIYSFRIQLVECNVGWVRKKVVHVVVVVHRHRLCLSGSCLVGASSTVGSAPSMVALIQGVFSRLVDRVKKRFNSARSHSHKCYLAGNNKLCCGCWG